MKIIIALLSGLLAFAASNAQTGNAVKTRWIKQQDSSFNFSFQYPADWQLKLPGTNTRFFVTSYLENDSDNFRENINCITRKLEDTGFSIRSAEAVIKESLATNFSNFKLIKSGYVKWNDTDAFYIEYTCLQKTADTEFETHMYQQMANAGGLFFTLTYTAESKSFSRYEAVIKKIIQSVKVTR